MDCITVIAWSWLAQVVDVIFSFPSISFMILLVFCILTFLVSRVIFTLFLVLLCSLFFIMYQRALRICHIYSVSPIICIVVYPGWSFHLVVLHLVLPVVYIPCTFLLFGPNISGPISVVYSYKDIYYFPPPPQELRSWIKLVFSFSFSLRQW